MNARAMLAIAAAGLLAACASETYPLDVAPEFVAAKNGVPFYAYGPGQFGPPEARLQAGERVRMIRKEFGYSRVRIASGLTGYMANDDLLPAPPLPKLRVVNHAEIDDDVDMPVVDDAALPEPDLRETPEDAPPAG